MFGFGFAYVPQVCMWHAWKRNSIGTPVLLPFATTQNTVLNIAR